MTRRMVAASSPPATDERRPKTWILRLPSRQSSGVRAGRVRGGGVLASTSLGELHLPDLARMTGGREVVLVLEGPAEGEAVVEITVTGDAAAAWRLPEMGP